jgi:DNA mismatch repair protein MSH6
MHVFYLLFFFSNLNYFRGTSEYIPNDLVIGNSHDGSCSLPEILLLSGPNMGGKSTLLRQTCLIVILAQLGCKVPADYCSLTPVDRIYTRIGATDKILSGLSTFFVELAETATILRSATQVFVCIVCLKVC